MPIQPSHRNAESLVDSYHLPGAEPSTVQSHKSAFCRRASSFRASIRRSLSTASRRDAVVLQQRNVKHEQDEEHDITKLLKKEIARLDPNNRLQVDAWVNKMKQGLSQAEKELKKEGVKDISLDLIMERRFQNYTFTQKDYPLLGQLKRLLNDDRNVIHHLYGKVCRDIVESRGFDSQSIADQLAQRSNLCRKAAYSARMHFLMGASPEQLKEIKLNDEIGEIIGLPVDLRPDLELLYAKLSSEAAHRHADGRKAKALKKDIESLLSNDEARSDIGAVNRLVIKVRKGLHSMESLSKRPDFRQWPDTYPDRMP